MTLAKRYAVRCDRCGITSHYRSTSKDARATARALRWLRKNWTDPPVDLCPRCRLEPDA